MVAKNIGEERRGGIMDNYNSIAVTSRIRFARNFSNISFISKLTDDDEIDYLVQSTRGLFEHMGGFAYYSLSKIPLSRCTALLERHIISKELIENRDISSVIINEDESIIIMVGEEDHIREQSISKGFDLQGAYDRLLPIDEEILTHFNIAYDDEYGFLTSSPANLGPAMRASIMVFIPALERNGKIDELISSARKYGLTFRGMYGEGTDAIGSFYQISNQGSLGLTEEEIVDKVSDFFLDVSKQEESLRGELFDNNYIELRDEVQRAYGILTNCYSITENEMIKLLSLLKLGSLYDMVKIKDEEMFMKLYYHGGGSNLKEIIKFSKEKKENVVRAEYISKRVKNLVFLGGEL